jgi:ABC-type branched-subunit amino acid transport system substrate-binding protein
MYMKRRDHRSYRPARLLVVMALIALVLTACGSSKKTSSGGATTATTGASTAGSAGTAAPSAKLTGTPIKTMTIASVNYNGPTYANILESAKLYQDWVNAHGGIKGHPLEVTTCDEQGQPQKTAACGRTAIADHDVAIVGSFTLNGAAIVPELAAAKTSWFGICCAASAIELVSPVVQQIGSGGGLNGTVVKAVQDGCKTMSVIIDDTGASDALSIDLVKSALASLHSTAKVTKYVLIPLTAQDYSPQVAEATSGAECIIGDVTENVWPGFLTAYAEADATARLYGFQGNLDAKTVKPFPKQTQNAVVTGYYPDITLPQWADYRAAIAQYHAPSNEDYNSLGGLGTWAAYYGFQQVVDSMTGPINNVTFLKAAQTATDVNMGGLAPNADFAKKFEGLGKFFLNDTNNAVTFDIVKDGKLTPFDNGKFFDQTAGMLGQSLPAADIPPAGSNS